jgi:hypothetical protein
MIVGKVATVAGFGDVGKGCFAARGWLPGDAEAFGPSFETRFAHVSE